MRSRTFTERLPLAMAAVLVVLLALLALLQWRWIGEVSRLEQQRMRARLHAAGAAMARDFDGEVTRIFLAFHPEVLEDPAEGMARTVRQYERWRAEAPYPGLVKEVLLVRRGEAGGLDLLRLAPGARDFVPVPWPADLAEVRRDLERAPRTPEQGFREFAQLVHLVPEVPAMVVPCSLTPPPADGAAPGPPAPPSGDWARSQLVLRLDPRVIAGEILPDLTRRHFGDATGGEYAVAVLDRRQPQRALFLSDPVVPAAAFGDADARLGIFGLRLFEQMHVPPGPPGRAPGPGRAGEHLPPLHRFHDWLMRSRGGGGHGHGGAPPPGAGSRQGDWVLAIKHRDGSLEEVVTAVRGRNLAVSLGALALLAATAALMVVTTHRAQRLARQQIEFVAGVTHELHTPLTAIRSAGQNLADGVASGPEQVRRYGTLIESEGRRLSDMVGQALELAGIQSGRRIYHPRPVAVAEIVGGALTESRWLLEERGIEVGSRLEEPLPPVLADPASLRRAVANLIENAVKHGGRGGWVGIAVRQAGPGEVEIAVSDRGSGIRREDLPHLFEPFYRGRDAGEASVPGSGLGLALVRHIAEAHGGRISVTSQRGAGSTFTLRLPTAPAPAAPATREAPEGTESLKEPA